jgi:plasmid stabilization system protein ParE
MKIKVLNSFNFDLNEQVAYIAKDKPAAARRFKKEIIDLLKDLNKSPYKNRHSIYFEDENVRDLIFKGYTIVYLIKPEIDVIEIFGLIKYRDGF